MKTHLANNIDLRWFQRRGGLRYHHHWRVFERIFFIVIGGWPDNISYGADVKIGPAKCQNCQFKSATIA
ncbi:MAG: hypothetical protein Q4B70_18855 [Lachnospiraceae bacterium]|nr:hypothetical protein [Lachnospiraceae bacterium]